MQECGITPYARRRGETMSCWNPKTQKWSTPRPPKLPKKEDNQRIQTLNNLTVELGHLVIHSQIAINFYLRQRNLLGKEAEESAERSFVKVAQIAEELGWLK